MQVNAAVYCRISKDRVGAGLGVERQRQDCEELAARLGWNVVAVHQDNDISAYSGKARPGYQDLLGDLRSGRVTAVLAWHPDRLHRRPLELESFISICEQHGVTVQTVRAGEIDLSTPSGRAVARTVGAWARHEVEHSIDKQKRAKLQAAQAGKYRGGRRPFGYLKDGMTIDIAEQTVVQEMATRTLAGESLRSIAADLNNRGSRGTRGGEWTGAAVRDVLLRPRNAALISHEDEIVGPALWEPLLDEDLWTAVRYTLTAPGRSHGKSAARVWLGSGLYLCGLPGCDRTVRISSTRSGRPVARWAYRCSGTAVHVSRSADRLDDLVTDAVLERLSRPDAVKLIRPRGKLVDVTALHTEATGIRAQIEELGVLWARKTLTATQVGAATAELNADLKAVELKIATATTPSPLTGLAGSKRVARDWPLLGLDRQRAVVDTLMTVTVLPGKRGRKIGGHYFDPTSVRIDWRG